MTKTSIVVNISLEELEEQLEDTSILCGAVEGDLLDDLEKQKRELKQLKADSRNWENAFVENSFLLESIDDLLAGKEISDFAESFPIVYKVQELMLEKKHLETVVESYVALVNKMMEEPTKQEKFSQICKNLKMDN